MTHMNVHTHLFDRMTKPDPEFICATGDVTWFSTEGLESHGRTGDTPLAGLTILEGVVTTEDGGVSGMGGGMTSLTVT